MTARHAVVGAVVLAALVSAGCGPPRVGVVDSGRILNESLPALAYQKQLDDREKAMTADLRLLVGRLNQADLEARRQTHLRELEGIKRELEDRLNEQVRKAVEEVARDRRMRLVLVKQATPLGGVDVTEDVLNRLK